MNATGRGDSIEEPAVERLPSRDEATRAVGPSAGKRRLALLLALGVDFMQWVAFPLFMSGALSPVSDAVDVATAVVMISLLGWHWSFLPTFVAEIIPGIGLVPTWTLAVWLATRGKK